MIEVVTLTSTFADTSEHRVTAMLLGNVVDQLHERHRLTHTGAAKQTDFTALGDRHDQVYNLDTRFEQLCGRCLLFVGRRSAMNRQFPFGANIAGIVDWVAEDVHDAAQCFLTDRYGDWLFGIGHRHTTLQALARTHRNRAHDTIAQLLLYFERDVRIVDDQRVVYLGIFARRELNVHNGADNLHSSSSAHSFFLFIIHITRRARFYDASKKTYPDTAAAPPTISEISCVIAA